MRGLPVALAGLLLTGCVYHEHVDLMDPGVNPVTVGEATTMAAAGYPDSTILKKIDENGVAARPDADEIVKLKEAGAGDAVVQAMLEAPITQYRPPVEHRTVYVRDYTPSVVVGAAAVGGFFLGTHFSHRHYYHHRSYRRQCR